MTCKFWTRIKGLYQDHQRKVSKLNWSSPSIMKSRTTISFHLMLEKRKRKSKIVVIPKSRSTILFQAKLDLILTKRKLKVIVIPQSRTLMFQQKLNQAMRKMKFTFILELTLIPDYMLINISNHTDTQVIIINLNSFLNDYISLVLNLFQLFNSH